MRGRCDDHHVRRSATDGERRRRATKWRRDEPARPQPNPGRRSNRSARRTRPAAPRTRSRRRQRQQQRDEATRRRGEATATATATRRDATTRRRSDEAARQGGEAAVRRGGATRRRDKAARRQRREGTTAARRRNRATAQPRNRATDGDAPNNGDIPQSNAATFDSSHLTHRAENTSPRTPRAYRSIRAKYLVITAFTLVAFPNISFRYPNTAAPYYSPLCSTKVIASPFFQ
ncbi:hypothetical protein SAMN04244553_5119 [Nocardia amikacinitolerans]|uniref:Uncharacterized protein n=1 Tax=Nocardia amikacinitolerans TaxID=756689 RepID=A0A285LVJ6_9NOCA|nr:hypothetical protein SAMN04244553_5119 [Nocardia amikacinitolerans]